MDGVVKSGFFGRSLFRPGGWSITDLIGISLMVLVIANGLSYFLKKVGVLEKAPYTKIMTFLHCKERRDSTLDGAGRLVPCRHEAGIERGSDALSTEYLYWSPGFEIVLKSLKELFGVLIVIAATFLLLTGRTRLPSVSRAWPVYVLAGSFSLSLLIALWTRGPFVAAAGLRTFALPIVAIAVACIGIDLPRLAKWVMWTLLIEMFLIPVDILYGIPLSDRTSDLWGVNLTINRATGTLIMPNSLGGFAVLAVALYTSLRAPKGRPLILLASFVTAVMAGAGTAVLAVCVIAGACWGKPLVKRLGLRGTASWISAGVLLVALILLLPSITGRPEILEGVEDRWDILRYVIVDRPSELVAGRGLGVSSNVLIGMVSGGYTSEPTAQKDPLVTLDSSVSSLLLQTGLIGAAAFYGSLFWGIRRNPSAALFFWIAALISLTVNLPEFFPANTLVALALGQCAAAPGINGQPTAGTG